MLNYKAMSVVALRSLCRTRGLGVGYLGERKKHEIIGFLERDDAARAAKTGVHAVRSSQIPG